LLREFELDRPAGLLLDDRRAVAQSPSDAQIVDLQADEVAARSLLSIAKLNIARSRVPASI
jgi:hypothetical protein